jgi:protoheme IX farnesyltransferase
MASQMTSHTALIALTRLFRLPLALMVALTAVAAAITAGQSLSGTTLAGLGWGIFLLAAASSVLNQVQERTTDALLRRTCRRPIACGLLPVASGIQLGLLLATAGTALLLLIGGLAPALLGLAALVWYLVVYTPLKRITPLAVLAGTPCGSVPVLIGWLVAGGTLPAPQPFALALVLLLWQVPHYWLLALPERDELAAAGFRVLSGNISNHRLLVLSHRWILGLALTTLLLPALELVTQPLARGGVVALALALVVCSTWLLRRTLFAEIAARYLRIGLSFYLLFVLLLLLVGG